MITRPQQSSLKLVYAINGLGPGGAELSLVELLPFYLAHGIESIVVCMQRKDKRLEPMIRRLGCEVRFLPGGGMIARVRALRRMLRTDQVDLVHTTLFESDIAGRLAAAGSAIPVVTSLVNTSYDPARRLDPNVGKAALWVTRIVEGWTARHLTAHFHAVSKTVKESAVENLHIPAERITVIERGRDPERLGSPGPERRRAARRRLGLSDEDEVILNVGRQEYQKGQKYLLSAASILARERPRMVVLVCGREGHASGDLKELCHRLGLGERVRFLGYRVDAPEVLAAADVFAFPSVYEGLPGAVIEAMALGLPIVASDIPALREIVEDGANGLLAKPESPLSLARALARILDDRATAVAFGARSRQIFQERFTIERSAERMIDLYHRLMIGRAEAARRHPAVAGS